MTPRSSNASPRPPPARFDAELLTPYIKKLLQSTLGSQRWPEHKEREKVKLWCTYRRQPALGYIRDGSRGTRFAFSFPCTDSSRVPSGREICERVKERMLEIEPRGL